VTVNEPGFARELGELLKDCPKITVLATSRVNLNLDGETVYLLKPLPLPSTGIALGAEALTENPCIRILAANQADLTTFVDKHAATLVQICRRLDGLPLWLKLAAPRLVKDDTPEELLRFLTDRLAELQGGSAEKPERLRSLRALIAWSLDTLSSAEQRLFRTLAIWPGPISRDSIEAFFGGERNSPESSARSLNLLLRHNLLSRYTVPGSTTTHVVMLVLQ